jgi:release factor glutamine methyltransferase
MNFTRKSKELKKVFFENCIFNINENVYEPAEDTFLLAKNLSVKEGNHVLDIGTGCGIIAILAAKKNAIVVATDINPYALKCARNNAKLNEVYGKIEFRLGSLFEPIRSNEKFDLIAFNAPYLPSEKTSKEETLIEKAWSGGLNGREIIDAFLSQVSNFLKEKGKVLLVQSSLCNTNETLQKFAKNGMKARIRATLDGFFEKIVLLEAENQ